MDTPTLPVVPLTKNVAEALLASQQEIDRLQSTVQMLMAILDRHTSALIRDAGHDPKLYTRYELKGDALHLIPKG